MRFALVTPSFYLDYDICRILIESVHRHVPEDVKHYLIVSADDVKLFKGFADSRTRVLVQEEVVQERFWRVPFARRWRVNMHTLPIRGWIWQQMVKMSIAQGIDADAYMCIDSDCFFVKPFDPRSLVQDGKVPIFREEKDFYKTHDDTQKWAVVSRQLLRLPPLSQPYSVGYVNSWALWRRDVLTKLQQRVSNGGNPTAWLYRLGRNMRFSEYSLYGMFVDHVLTLEQSGHYGFGRHLSLDHWSEQPFDGAGLDEFKRQLKDEAIVMINARSRTSPAENPKDVRLLSRKRLAEAGYRLQTAGHGPGRGSRPSGEHAPRAVGRARPSGKGGRRAVGRARPSGERAPRAVGRPRPSGKGGRRAVERAPRAVGRAPRAVGRVPRAVGRPWPKVGR